jgi:hypothetical protein
MPQWLCELPNWLPGALLALASMSVGVLGHAVFRGQSRLPPMRADTDPNTALTLLAAAGCVSALLLALSALSVWEGFGAAGRVVRSEATTVGELGRDLAVFGSAESRQARERLRLYTQAIIGQEWPAMREGQSSQPTFDAFDQLFRAVGDLHPSTPRETSLMHQIWTRTDELVKLRSERLEANRSQVPAAWWGAVLLGALLTALPACMLPRTRYNGVAIGLLSIWAGLLVFFVVTMDRPFAGRPGVSAAPLESALQDLERWDAMTAAFRAAADPAR